LGLSDSRLAEVLSMLQKLLQDFHVTNLH